MRENKKRKIAWFSVVVFLLAGLCTYTADAISVQAADITTADETVDTDVQRPRVLVTQDGESDDMNSLIRFLLYANQFEVEGIVQSASTFHYSGNDENEPYRWPGTDWINDYLDAYEKYYENLIVHEDGFPTPDYLRERTAVGNVEMVGEMEKDTEGSNLIKNVLLDDDDRMVYLMVWGGSNTIARALKSIEEEYAGTDNWEKIYHKVSKKAAIFMIGSQDNTYTDYIAVNWPDVQGILQSNWITYAFIWENRIPEAFLDRFYGDWMYENITANHGDLMALYHTWLDGHYYEGEEDGSQFGTNTELPTTWWGYASCPRIREQYDFISEGDTPSFLNFIDVGLRSNEDFAYGGWGGRFTESSSNYFTEVNDPNTDDGIDWINSFGNAISPNSVGRWIYDAMGDFAARADWLVTANYEDANHPPVVSVEENLDINVVPGETVTLHGNAEDPDGDDVLLSWMYYRDAGTYDNEIEMIGADSADITFIVPADAQPGDTIHMVLTGRDNGAHELARYQRVILTVEEPAELSTEFLDYMIAYAEEQKANGALNGVIQIVVDKFESALANAKAVLESASSQSQIDEAASELLNVIHMLDFKGDKSELQSLVYLVSRYLDNEESYTPATFAVFKEAYNAAESVLDDATALQDEIDDAWDSLADATAKLRFKPNKDLLNALINESKAYSASLYTFETVTPFLKALEKAQAVSDDDNAEADQVEDAYGALHIAVKELELLPTGVSSQEENTSNTDESATKQTVVQETSNPKTGESNGIVWLLVFLSALVCVFCTGRNMRYNA